MKKRLAILAAVSLLVVSVAGCGSSDEVKQASSVDASLSTSEEEAVADSDSEEDTDADDNQIVFEELTVVDNDECSIVLSNYSETKRGCTIRATLENKSSDITYMFSVVTASVNGVDSDPYFASTVTPGKISNETIDFTDSDLTDNGITDFTDIELTFHVYDSDDWGADDVAYETVHVYPYGEENATSYVRESQDTDTVIVDNDYVTAIVTGYEPDGTWGYTVNLYLVNKTDNTVMFSVDDASVNGFMSDPFYATSVGAGHCAFSSIDWSDSDLEDNGIDEVEEIEMQFRAYNYDDWMADDYFNEMITLNP